MHPAAMGLTFATSLRKFIEFRNVFGTIHHQIIIACCELATSRMTKMINIAKQLNQPNATALTIVE
jgi:hypothetical protein